MKEFREGGVWVLICTELLSRGMDFRGVDLVVNYDFPTSVQSYVHRIGEFSVRSLWAPRCLSKEMLTFSFASNRSNWTSWTTRKGDYLLHQRGCSLSQDVRLHLLSPSSQTKPMADPFFFFSRNRIANVMRQSGCEVPEWMLAFVPVLRFFLRLSLLIVDLVFSHCSLKNPSKKERKQVKRRPVERTDVRTVGGSGLGRQASQKKRFVSSHPHLTLARSLTCFFSGVCREMVEGSKRRKTKPTRVEGAVGGGKMVRDVDLQED